MHTTLLSGELQIDHERGVIYFHASIEAVKQGYTATPLRICGLGNITAPLSDRQIDISCRPLVVQGHQLSEVFVTGVK